MKWKTPGTVASLLLLTVLTLACLLPFIGKAFHIDDPLFVWCARQIQSHPVDFYGFKLNWDGAESPMAAITQNPPLASYYMAPAGALFGWNEVALHAWFLLPALALIAGTWFLARRFCSHPLAAALMTITAPVFLLSSTSVMCDTMMLALWVWAVVFWLAGLAQNSPARLCVAALLVAACGLTKYFGLSLIPLLLAYSLMERRRAGTWLAWLLVPVLVMAFYQWLTSHLYGRGLLFNAVSYATNLRVGGDLPERVLTGLAFCGGCILILLPLAPLLWGKRALAGGIFAVILLGLLVVILKKANQFSVVEEGHVKWLFVVQFSCAVVAGVSLVVLAVADWLGRKTPASMLLFLWVAGTLLFSCAVNWTVSGRNILPMLPAVSILLVRRLELRSGPDHPDIMGRLWAPLGFSLAIALLATCADYRLAGSARDAAAIIMQKADAASSPLWFEGHWGFQYYMEQQGDKPLDVDHHHLLPRDIVVMPTENSYLVALSPDHFALWFKHDGATLPWLTTMNGACGAGYYSDAWGPLPYVFGRVPADEYQVFRVK
jgi:4-amino-4-deoxy-L-arabinose transferase-like glycosyltransferase